MRVGIYTDARNPPLWRKPWPTHYGRLLEQISEAERLGIDEVWFSEHHGFEDGYLSQPLALMAAVAARTTRIGLGTAIVLAALRPAVLLAEEAALVDVVSGGRLQLGVGAGYREAEYSDYGANFAARFQTLEERVRELREIWDRNQYLPGPVQERIPIWIGALGARAARLAGRLGEGLLWLDPSLLGPYREGLRAGGHDQSEARVSGLANLVISDDPERDWLRVSPHVAYMFTTYARYANDAAAAMRDTKAGVDSVFADMSGGNAVDADALRSAGPVMIPPAFDVVTPAVAVARLRTWLEPMPVSSVFFWLSVAGMPDDIVERHLELLADEVRPAVVDLGLSAK